MAGTVKRAKTAAELLGAPEVARSGRGRLVGTAIDLFYSHGFHAVGLDRVLAEAGVTKTTFYKHFESKEDLVVEAIRVRDEWEARAWARAVDQVAGADPRARLLGLLEVMDRWFNAADFGGCVFLNAAIEFPDPRDPAHQAAAAHKKRNRDGWRDLARAAGAREAEAFADEYTAVVEGAIVLRHVHGRDDAARVVRRMVEKLIAEHMEEGEGGEEVVVGTA